MSHNFVSFETVEGKQVLLNVDEIVAVIEHAPHPASPVTHILTTVSVVYEVPAHYSFVCQQVKRASQ